MRQLNKKQKNLIDKWLKECYNNRQHAICYSSDQMPIELQQELERINNHETIWSNIDRYINDQTLEMVHKR
jgi:hypothetical protein